LFPFCENIEEKLAITKIIIESKNKAEIKSAKNWNNFTPLTLRQGRNENLKKNN